MASSYVVVREIHSIPDRHNPLIPGQPFILLRLGRAGYQKEAVLTMRAAETIRGQAGGRNRAPGDCSARDHPARPTGRQRSGQRKEGQCLGTGQQSKPDRPGVHPARKRKCEEITMTTTFIGGPRTAITSHEVFAHTLDSIPDWNDPSLKGEPHTHIRLGSGERRKDFGPHDEGRGRAQGQAPGAPG